MNAPAPTSLENAAALHGRGRHFDALMLARAALKNPGEEEVDWLRIGIGSLLALSMPAQAEAFFIRAAALLNTAGKVDDAVACYREALEKCPHTTHLLLHAGLFFAQAKQADVAERCYREAVELDPSSAPAWNNLGNLLKDRTLNAEAEACYRRALELKPDFLEGLNNYAVFLQEEGKYEESLPFLERALAVDLRYAAAYLNLGGAMMNLLRHDAAERHYRKALEVMPVYPEARFNLGMCLLMQGKEAEGWACYEARFDPARRVRMSFPPVYPFPRWQNESLEGKTLLVWQEQGIGDQLMFAFWLKALKRHTGAKVVVVCHSALKDLVARIDGVDYAAGAKDSIPWSHYWTFAMSLPFHLQALQAEIPPFAPYLAALPERLQALAPLMETVKGFKVGLCWKGSAHYRLDHLRSPGIAPFKPLLALKGVKYFTLLPDTRAEFAAWAGAAGVDLGHEIDQHAGRFEETIALMTQLDLVITSDTSIAHFARALGKPTWIVLPYAGEWRWVLHPSRGYPGLRLFRQQQPGDWPDVFARVAGALREAIRHAK